MQNRATLKRTKQYTKTPINTVKYIYRNTKIRIKFNDGISEPIHINKE